MSKISSYPHGFSSGLLVRNEPIIESCPGKIYWVGNNASLLEGEKQAADNNLGGKGGTFLQPFNTVDYAIGQCAAGRGDIIYVRPVHNETISAAGGWTLDVSGVQIIGLGSGEVRPIVTFATSTAASILVSAGNCRISNIVMKCNIASQAHMLDIKAKDFMVDHCDLREGTATGLFFVVADTADADSDRLKILGCEFYAPTAGNMDAAIQLAKDFKQVRIVDCDIFGDFDNAGIEIPAGGNAQQDLRIIRCRVDNLLTGVHAIKIDSTTNTGMIIECYLQGDTLAAIVDSGGLSMFETYVHDKADQSYAIVTGTAVS